MTDAARPKRLYSRLHAVHQREQLLGLLLGAFAFGAWLILLFLASFAVDWLVHLPRVVRIVLLPLLLGVATTKAWQRGWRRLRAFSATESALKAEGHGGELQSLLVSGVQLEATRSASGASESMSALTIQNADEAAGEVDTKAVVPFGPLRTPAAIAGLLLAVVCALAIINTPLLLAGLTRIFAPWQVVRYPTRTSITLENSQLVVKEGSPVVIRARLGGEVPAKASLALRTGKGKPRKRSLDVVEDVCEYKIGSAFRTFDYAIRAGDAETDWQTVRVISSPRIVKTEIRVVYPAYMKRDAETMEAMTLTVPEGVSMEWALTLDQPLSAASFSIEGGEPLPLALSDDGLTVRHKMAADASGAYAFAWVEKAHGFTFDTPKSYLQVAPDQPPQIELVAPAKNLFATLGRKLDLAYRVRDDHGVGEGHVVYRRDNTAEQRVPFAPERSEGRRITTVDWDYREALKALAVGESVAFALEVADRYPSPDGPHRVRSETRRVSFLSRQDYLAKIQEQKDRLLSQLRSIYRQERAAYDVIRALDPQGDAFEQTCFLESARQDILAERIALLCEGMHELVLDLTANNISDQAEFEGLNALQARLAGISSNRINEAASRLRDLGPAANRDAAGVAETARIINDAARELGSVVLQLGVHEAMEVFAMELHVIAQSQSTLRVACLDATGQPADLAARQQELSAWVSRLLAELSESRDYSKAPLTIVRLARMIKDLRAAGIETAMQAAATHLTGENLEPATQQQKQVIAALIELECNIRVGSEYEALLDAHELFSTGPNELASAAAAPDTLTAAARHQRLDSLLRSLRLLILPALPAPEPELLAETPTTVPPVDALLVSLRAALRDAMAALDAGTAEGARTQQRAAGETLRTLDNIIKTRLDTITRVARYAGHAGSSMERSSLIRELLASQMRLTEKTEDAEYDEVSAAYLAPSQLHLSKEVLKMRDRLARKNRGDSASKTVAPMLKMLEQASAAMLAAAPALKAEKLGEAIEQQDRVLDALQAAMAFSNHEANGWMGLANLIMTAEGLAMPARYMRDIVAEQQDLIADTKTSTPESRTQLMAIQKNLALAVLDVSLLVEGTGSALDFEQAMLFAGSDMGLSVLKLESGDVPGAMQAQRLATESVEDLSRQFDGYEKQFYYFVTAMEFLQERHTDSVVLQDALGALIAALEGEGAEDKQTGEAVLRSVEQAALLGTRMQRATGRADYTRAHAALTNATKAWKAEDRDACMDEVFAAEGLHKESLDELRELMAKVAFIPSVDPIEAPPEYDVMLEMVSLLLDQRRVARLVYEAGDGTLAELAPQVGDLVAAATDLVDSTAQHSFMVGAHKHLTDVAAGLATASRADAYGHLHASEELLRQCILEYALYYVEIKRPRGSKRKKKGKSSIVTMFKMSNKIKPAYDKDWGGVEGEDAESGRSEWEVLGRRNRAALHENFVRELPLEYREFLKDYYERLAE
ncbi:MAG: hypothetical protein HN919_10055 [Verrucomicrobia bacterium]|nr:hypothetical protein [Verrucomicrobiota bacterium]MBT7066634.1 hypothetical protein [Verrucomicrobiota bacterium]MBT7700393.1 hypothetical protein [Verrucomicrobiota bacterium]